MKGRAGECFSEEGERHSSISLHRTSILEIYYQYQEKISKRSRSKGRFKLQNCPLYYMLTIFAYGTLCWFSVYKLEIGSPGGHNDEV